LKKKETGSAEKTIAEVVTIVDVEECESDPPLKNVTEDSIGKRLRARGSKSMTSTSTPSNQVKEKKKE
jgi:hypothetical protein